MSGNQNNIDNFLDKKNDIIKSESEIFSIFKNLNQSGLFEWHFKLKEEYSKYYKGNQDKNFCNDIKCLISKIKINDVKNYSLKEFINSYCLGLYQSFLIFFILSSLGLICNFSRENLFWSVLFVFLVAFFEFGFLYFRRLVSNKINVMILKEKQSREQHIENTYFGIEYFNLKIMEFVNKIITNKEINSDNYPLNKDKMESILNIVTAKSKAFPIKDNLFSQAKKILLRTMFNITLVVSLINFVKNGIKQGEIQKFLNFEWSGISIFLMFLMFFMFCLVVMMIILIYHILWGNQKELEREREYILFLTILKEFYSYPEKIQVAEQKTLEENVAS